MNIKQLIEILRQYPDEMRVIVEGYEDGFNDITIVEEKEIAINVLTEWYYGQHIATDDIFRMEEIKNPIIEKVLLINGENNLAKEDDQ
jgi:hypothetical protein